MSTAFLIDSVANATAHRDRDDLDAAVARLVFEFIDAKRVAVYRVIDDGSEPRLQRRLALMRDGGELGPENLRDPARLPRVADYSPWHECVALRDCVHYEAADGSGLRSLFPLLGENQAIGLLEVDADGGLDPRDAGLIHGILRIVRNHLALLDYGERDTLTGLLNRKTFEASFGKLRERAAQASVQEPPWLAVVDVDRFKSVNDNYGHLFGDEVLLLVSHLMRSCFRGADQLFRFGGEEFVIALDAASRNGAAIAFNRLRGAVEQFAFPQVGRVTVSIGYTRLAGSDSSAAAIERADAALYLAKSSGRNQALGYEALIDSGRLRRKEERADVVLF
jgi:diguanylate cyclase (GGDEF)-like protein